MEGSMKATIAGFIFVAGILLAPFAAAETGTLSGTWSGNWTPKGGVPDAVTIELKQDSNGMLSGRFVNPARIDFNKASFIARTSTITLEATDNTGKHYKLDGKVEGNEIKGTLA